MVGFGRLSVGEGGRTRRQNLQGIGVSPGFVPANRVTILFACQPRTVRTTGETVFTSHPDARLLRMNDAATFSLTQDEVRALVVRVGRLDNEAHAAADAGLWTAAVVVLRSDGTRDRRVSFPSRYG